MRLPREHYHDFACWLQNRAARETGPEADLQWRCALAWRHGLEGEIPFRFGPLIPAYMAEVHQQPDPEYERYLALKRKYEPAKEPTNG
jgi:hypothetical protein